MRRLMKPSVAGFCMLILMSVAMAAEMTPKDIIHLKKLGFSDAVVKAEVEKSGNAPTFTDAELQQLKDAGAGVELIDALRRPGPRKLTMQAIVELVKQGKSAEQILDAMIAAPTHYDLQPADALEMTKEQVPAAVLLAMQGAPLELPALKLLAEGKTPAPVYSKLASLVGISREELKGADAQALSAAGVPDDVIAGLKEGRAATVGPSVGESDLKQYHHVDRYFTIHHPLDWKLIREIKDGGVCYCFTPEVDKAKIDDVEVAVTVRVMVPDANSALAGKDPVALLRHLLPQFRADEPDLVSEGDIVPAKLGQLKGARLSFKGTLRNKTEKYAREMYVALDHGMYFFVTTGAPQGKLTAFDAVFTRVIEHSEFGHTAIAPRGDNQQANDIISRYKQSVVCIVTENDAGPESQGTGFIIQKNGYVATNAHVAVDLDENGKPWKKYMALFDSDTGRKPLPLTYVGHRFHQSRLKEYHGVDVALFKLPPGEYTPLQLTPSPEVRLGDPIVTMGFPHYFDYDQKKPSLFTTTGSVTRFNRTVDGLDSIYMDAKITHGNSGGPCISRVTGGVIGLNTFGASTPNAKDQEDMVGYNGLVPVDVLIGEFPLEAELGLDPGSEKVDFYDSYALAQLYMTQGRHRASVDLARNAVRLLPQSADAYCLLGLCLLKAATETGNETCDFKASSDEAETALNKALECDENHLGSLLALSEKYLSAKDVVSAAKYAERAVSAHPDDFQSQLQYAHICLLRQRYDEALAAATKAKAAAHDVNADGYIMAGLTLYQQGKLEEGKAEFVRGSEIHPSNLAAREGVGRYYELKGDYTAAVAEYERVNRDLPDNPQVALAMGRCYDHLREYSKALDFYLNSVIESKDLGRKPLLEAYLAGGRILTEVRRMDVAAIAFYGLALEFHGATPEGAELHVRLARLFKKAGWPGVAFSHLRRAASLLPDDPKIKQELADRNLTLMSMDDVSQLLKGKRYESLVVADMVLQTPLDFSLLGRMTDETETKLLELGFNYTILLAARQSNNKFPPPVARAEDAYLTKLQGKWNVVSRNKNGEMERQDKIKDSTLVIDGRRFTFSDHGIPQTQNATTDPSKSPAWIDLDTIPGIYRICGDELQICFDKADGAARPVNFSSSVPPARSDLTLIILKRPPGGGESGDPALDEIQGTWSAISFVTPGKALSDETMKDIKVTIEGNKLTLAGFGNRAETVSIAVDGKKTPAWMDLRSDDDKPLPGIFKLDGNILQMCWDKSPAATRPKDFSPPAPGGETFVLTLKRLPAP